MFKDWFLNELFSTKIRNVWKLTDYYLLKLIYNIFDTTDILSLLDDPISLNKIIEQKKYPEHVRSALKWMLDRLELDGYLSKIFNSSIEKYQLTDKKMDYDLDEVKSKAEEMAPDSLAAFNMLKLIADTYPAYLEGNKSCIEVIFSPEHIDVTNEYYSNNLFYKVHNIAGAKILNYDMESRKDPVVVEIGGGMGGGTKHFLSQKLKNSGNAKGFTYYFTDIANKMLRTTKRELLNITDDISSFNFQKLNFNKNLSEQGYAENSADIIWGVNALHVAYDLRFTLNQIYKTLKPGGSFIISETVRPVGNRMIQQELLLNTITDYWNVKLDDEIRPRYGFMDWTDWINAFEKTGYSQVESIPDMKAAEKEYDNCYIAIIRGKKPE